MDSGGGYGLGVGLDSGVGGEWHGRVALEPVGGHGLGVHSPLQPALPRRPTIPTQACGATPGLLPRPAPLLACALVPGLIVEWRGDQVDAVQGHLHLRGRAAGARAFVAVYGRVRLCAATCGAACGDVWPRAPCGRVRLRARGSMRGGASPAQSPVCSKVSAARSSRRTCIEGAAVSLLSLGRPSRRAAWAGHAPSLDIERKAPLVEGLAAQLQPLQCDVAPPHSHLEGVAV